jgi:hypothetical protein
MIVIYHYLSSGPSKGVAGAFRRCSAFIEVAAQETPAQPMKLGSVTRRVTRIAKAPQSVLDKERSADALLERHN